MDEFVLIHKKESQVKNEIKKRKIKAVFNVFLNFLLGIFFCLCNFIKKIFNNIFCYLYPKRYTNKRKFLIKNLKKH